MTAPLSEYDGPDKIISSYEMEIELRKHPEFLLNVKSGIPSLDRAVGGFRDGELITISGPTKNGKTLLAQTMTVNFAKSNIFSLWFSFEVQPRRFIGQFKELPLIYMPAKLKAHAMPWVEEKIRESFEKYNTRVVFIDHLHYLFDIARSRNPSLDIGAIIRRLKSITVDGNFLIFVLCHTTKGKPDGDLSYEAIRDSSFVAQESDSVLMVKRTPDIAENAARVRVEFHRRTGVLEEVVYLQKQGWYLVETTPPDEGVVKPKSRTRGYHDKDSRD
jgi:hypothetical protein